MFLHALLLIDQIHLYWLRADRQCWLEAFPFPALIVLTAQQTHARSTAKESILY